MFVFWLGWKPEYCASLPLGLAGSTFVFLGVYALLVLVTGSWSRWLAGTLAAPNFGRSLTRFNRVMFAARIFIPLWFLLGIWALGWWQAVYLMLGHARADLIQTTSACCWECCRRWPPGWRCGGRSTPPR